MDWRWYPRADSLRSLREPLGAGGPVLLVMVPTVLGLLALGWRFELWIPRPWRPAARLVGAVLLLCGIGTVILAVQRLRRARAERRLCTSGPYRFVRHPLYAAWIWLLIPGVTLGLGFWPLGLAAPIMYLVTSAVLDREERRLREQFGDRYESYAASVPALVPWPDRDR